MAQPERSLCTSSRVVGKDSLLGGGSTGSSSVTKSRRGRDCPAADNPHRRPLGAVDRHDHSPVVCGHVGRQLVPVGETRGRAAPEDTKGLVKILGNTELGSTKNSLTTSTGNRLFYRRQQNLAPNTSTGSIL